MIFGRSGSGKSTFALALHKTLHLPLFHLDKYFYESHWQERDYCQFLEIQQALVEQDSWIIDGNATKSLVMRYRAADLVIYFNYPRWRCYTRVLKRFLTKKNLELDDRAPHCPETVNFKLLRYMWSFEERVIYQIARFKKAYPHVQFIEIRSDQELSALFNQLNTAHKNNAGLK